MRFTDAPFSPTEVVQIRRMVMTPDAALHCPRCETPLVGKDSLADEGAVAVRCRLIRCPACRLMMTMSD